MQCTDVKPPKHEIVVFSPRWLTHVRCGDCDIKRTTPCKDCTKKN